MATDAYITAEEAAAILQVTTRQVYRYANGDQPRLRTRKAGRRVLFHQGDAEQLAVDLDVANRPQPKSQRFEIMPPSDVLAYLRERDQQLAEVQNQLNQAMLRIGQLQGLLEQRLLPADERELRERLADVEQERDALRREVEQFRAENEG